MKEGKGEEEEGMVSSLTNEGDANERRERERTRDVKIRSIDIISRRQPSFTLSSFLSATDLGRRQGRTKSARARVGSSSGIVRS